MKYCFGNDSELFPVSLMFAICYDNVYLVSATLLASLDNTLYPAPLVSSSNICLVFTDQEEHGVGMTTLKSTVTKLCRITLVCFSFSSSIL